MSPDFIVGFSRQAVETTMLLVLPILGVGMIVGLAVSIFQSVTQIQEMTLTFVPKLIAVGIILLFLGNWMMHETVAFTATIIKDIPNYLQK